MKNDNKLQEIINQYGNKKNVETKSSTIHNVLENAGLIPGVGMAPDLANAALYGIEGDGAGTLMSLLGAIPGLGLGATVGKKANRAVIKLDKEGKIIKDKNFTDSFNRLSKEVDERQVAELNKGGIGEFSEFRDLERMREQARKIIQKLRESNTLDDLRKILGKSD